MALNNTGFKSLFNLNWSIYGSWSILDCTLISCEHPNQLLFEGILKDSVNITLLFGLRSELIRILKRVRQSGNITFVIAKVDIEECELYLLCKWVSPFLPLATKKQYPVLGSTGSLQISFTSQSCHGDIH